MVLGIIRKVDLIEGFPFTKRDPAKLGVELYRVAAT